MVSMRERIVVDIDNTLWDFAPVLYERSKALNPALPPPSEWHSWEFWKPYLTAKSLYGVIREIHMEQDRFGVYPETKEFLALLKDAGFYIIIASHREKGTTDAARQWLVKHDLDYDEIHLSYDKTVLFSSAWAVVDDSPVTLTKAKEAGIVRTGLRCPWNEKEDHPLFDRLPEVYNYLKTRCTR